MRRPNVSGRFLRFLIAVVVSFAVIFVVRTYWLAQLTVTSTRSDLGLQVGDRIIVNRWAWGGCQALPYVFKPSETLLANNLGEIVVYRHPVDSSSLRVGRINAPAGGGFLYKGRYPLPDCCIIDGEDVPCRFIEGRVEWVSYSIDTCCTFPDNLRRNRLFLRLP